MNTNFLIDELFSNIDLLQENVSDRYNFRILKEFDLTNIINLKKEVTDLDSLKLRITDITTQIIENFNKKELDKDSGINSKGSIESLKNFLKHNYSEESLHIDENIHNNLWAIYNLRTNFSHKKNRNYKKALRTLNLNESETDVKVIWQASLEALNTAFNNINHLILRTPEKDDYIYFEEFTIKKLKADHRVTISHLINYYPEAEPYLLYLLSKTSVSDIVLAKVFKHTVDDVRETLYPLTGDVILYSYKDEQSTEIYISNEVKEILKELLIKQ